VSRPYSNGTGILIPDSSHGTGTSDPGSEVPQTVQSISINGTAAVGEVLTAEVTPAAVAVEYQWLRNGNPIDGETGASYIPTDDDIGRRISVKVTYNGVETASNPTDLVSKGSGTETDPYWVVTAEQLDVFVRANLDKHFLQKEDIDLEGYDWEPIPSFSGVYDGNGKTIRNLKTDRQESDYVGLFSRVEINGVLRDITLENADVKGKDYVGSLVGENQGTIEGVHATGRVKGSREYAGGLAGNNSSYIENSYSTGEVNGVEGKDYSGSVGALAGLHGDGYFPINAIKYCYATGTSKSGSLIGTNSRGALGGGGSGGIIIIVSCYYLNGEAGPGVGGFGEQRTEEQMKKGRANSVVDGFSIYEEWSTEFWNFGGDDDYPTLKGMPGTRTYISGTAGVGETLSVDLPEGATWQWLRDGEPIEGTMNSPTYTISEEDVGRSFSVKVLMHDGSEWFTEDTPLVTKGSGTEGDPYHVATAAQLSMVRHHPDKHYIQTADIDLTGYNWEPIPSFSGVYDGNSKKIENLKIDKPDNQEYTGVGLFASLAGEGVLKNITLVRVDVVGYREVGSLVGISYGTIENCSAEGKVSGRSTVGGLVGWCYGLMGSIENSFIENSYAAGTVTGNTNVGGLVGVLSYNDITNSYYDSDKAGLSDSTYGRSTEAMQKGTVNDTTYNIYIGWSEDIWDFGGENDYPALKWSKPET
jgi:hypothetical protein